MIHWWSFLAGAIAVHLVYFAAFLLIVAWESRGGLRDGPFRKSR